MRLGIESAVERHLSTYRNCVGDPSSSIANRCCVFSTSTTVVALPRLPSFRWNATTSVSPHATMEALTLHTADEKIGVLVAFGDMPERHLMVPVWASIATTESVPERKNAVV